jgi:hypothetical protein
VVGSKPIMDIVNAYKYLIRIQDREGSLERLLLSFISLLCSLCAQSQIPNVKPLTN